MVLVLIELGKTFDSSSFNCFQLSLELANSEICSTIESMYLTAELSIITGSATKTTAGNGDIIMLGLESS